MIIPEKMADTAMREIINYYDAYPDHHIDKQFLVERGVCKPEEVDSLIKFLCSKKLIKYEPDDICDKISWTYIKLVNRHYLEDKRKERKATAKETRRFWIGIIIEIIKDLVIFALGLIAEGKFGIVRSILKSIC